MDYNTSKSNETVKKVEEKTNSCMKIFLKDS